MEIAVLVALAGLLVFAAHFFGWLFSLTSVPDVLLLMIVGILLGPVLRIVQPEFFGDFGQVVLTIALVVVLFESGITLPLAAVRANWTAALRVTLASFVVAAGGTMLFLWWLTDLPIVTALMVGVLLGGIEAAIVVPLLGQLRLLERSRTLLLVESALTDVLSIVLVIALLNAHATGALTVPGVAWNVVLSFGGAALLGVVVGMAWSLLLDTVRHMQNSIFVTPALLFILYGVVEWLGFSGLIAALVFGLTIGHAGTLNNYLAARHPLLGSVVRPFAPSRRERAFFGEVAFLLQTFFFVYVGLLIGFTQQGVLVPALGLVGFLVLLRYGVVRMSAPRSLLPHEAALMSVIVPKGVAAAVLAAAIGARGIPGGELAQEIVYAVILWSIVLTSVLVFLFERAPVARLQGWLFRGFGTEPMPGVRRFS